VVQESDLTPEEIETVPEPAQDYLLEVEELRARELPPEPETAFDLDLEAEAPPERSFVSEAEAQEVQPAEPAQAEPQPEERPGPVVEPPAPAAPAPAAHRPPPGRPVAERRQPMPVGADGESVLAQAQVELQRGNIPASLDQYMRLIKRGKYLEEIIRDLRDALYRYPVEVTIWQTLGDAYMRENRLQEALDSYTKAEELLR
jgi:tetratricopeptide (TPR) repeat protein